MEGTRPEFKFDFLSSSFLTGRATRAVRDLLLKGPAAGAVPSHPMKRKEPEIRQS